MVKIWSLSAFRVRKEDGMYAFFMEAAAIGKYQIDHVLGIAKKPRGFNTCSLFHRIPH